MKKILISLALLAPIVSFGLDANQMKYVEVLPAQAATLIQTNVSILAPVGATNEQTVASGASVDISAYPGTVLLQAGLGTGLDASYTGTLTVIFFTDTGSAQYTNTFRKTGTTAGGFESVEVNLDTYQGTNAALYVTSTWAVACTGNIGEGKASASLLRGAARADQTITGSAVDRAAYKGNATVWIQTGVPLNSAAAFTNIVTFQHAEAATGTWTTVTNLAGTAGAFTLTGASAQTQQFAIDLARLHRYIRATSVQKNDAASVGVTLIAPMKSE